MTLSNVQTAAGVTVPDTKLAREATELVRESTTDLIYGHSRRVYWWGSLQGRNRDLSYDPELLYIGAMFHDLGLNEEHRGSGRRFEVDSAGQAHRQILRAFTEGIAPRPETTFGNVKADVLERFVPGYQRGNFVDVIESSDWPE
jgi:hypothetical protein